MMRMDAESIYTIIHAIIPGMILENSPWNGLELISTVWFSAALFFLWAALIFWTIRDLQNRTKSKLCLVLAILAVSLLFLPGLLVYLLIRPRLTLEEEYHQSLQEESLLQSLDEVSVCPGCGRRIRDNWIVCPGCQTRLKKTCLQCGKPMDLPWNLCPYCGSPVPGFRRENPTISDALSPLPQEVE